MHPARESSVVAILRGAGGNEISSTTLKKQKSALLRWNKWAVYFPYVAIPAVVVGFIICRFAFNDLASYLFVGSVLSLIAEGFVIASYAQLKSWRKHPSRLLLYHSFSNVIFSIATIANALRAGRSDRSGDRDDSPDSTLCVTLSFFTQLAFFAGECWLFVISLDLVVSLSNPFSSIHGNLSKYKVSVWIASGISALSLIMSGECQGVTTDHVCWLHVENFGSGCLWSFILGWVAVYYIFSGVVLGYAYLRISRGLESTYETRKSCVLNHLNVLVAYVGYALLLMLLYTLYLVAEAQEGDSNSVGNDSPAKTLEYILSLLIGCRGVVDGLLWFRMQKSPRRASGRTLSVGGRLLSMVSTSLSRGPTGPERSTPLLPDSVAVDRDNHLPPDCSSEGRTLPSQDSEHGSSRRSLTTSGGTAGIAFRLWNGGTFASGDAADRESGLRDSSSTALPHRLSCAFNAEDRYGGSVSGASIGPASTSIGPDDDTVNDDNDDLWVDYSLNPQLNLALRQEVLHFVTQGILQSLHRATSVVGSLTSLKEYDNALAGSASLSESTREERLDHLGALPSMGGGKNTKVANGPRSTRERSVSLGTFLDNIASGSVSPPGSETVTDAYDYTFQLDQTHVFRDRYPLVFRRLRALVDISDEWYAHQIALPAQERLAEGASGAFMFFCGAGEFMVKTISAAESSVLCSILEKYSTHLSNNPESTLVRFMGLHELRMYNQTFNFVVMRNIFPPSATINLKYDIKGSWVNRSASGLMPPGTRSFCKHCSEPFRVGSSGKCPDRVGAHEPNLVLKDNDLTTKIRMKPEEAYEVIDALHKDSDALCQMGITDYSLLVGVRNLSYDVDPESTLYKRTKSFAAHANRDSFDSTLSANQSQGGKSNINPEAPTEEKDALDGAKARYVPPLAPGRSVNIPNMDGYQGNGTVGATPDVDGDMMHGGYAARAVIAPGIYYFGIVDILQTWSMEKIAEKMFKVYFLGNPEAGISCMAPEPYKERFQRKVSEVIEHSIFVRQVTGSWKGKRELTGPTALIPDS